MSVFIPSGIVCVMRQLEKDGYLPSAALSNDVRRCLAVLRDVYGAVCQREEGWQLAYAPEWLAPPQLSLPVVVVDEVKSTQRAIRRRSSPCMLFAEHQTAGIGRRGHGWLGLPADAIAMSLRLSAPPVCTGLSVALAAGLCLALTDDTRSLRFKWPNDIVNYCREKIAGILVEVVGSELIIGIGLNWRMTSTLVSHLAPSGNTPAALAEVPGAVASRQLCAQRIAQTVVDIVADYNNGFARFRDTAEALHVVAAGEMLQVAGKTGEFLGFADNGALILASGSQRIHHISGEVHYVAGG